MNFLNPLYVIGGLAALVPLLLHLVRRERAQKFEFPSLMFLRRVSRRYIRFQKLRHLLLLALRIAVLLLIALSFSRPFWEGPRAATAYGRMTQAHIILIDNSMSMAYGDRWERAQRAALEIVQQAQPSDKVGLLDFSDITVARVPPTVDVALLRELISNGVRPSDRPTRYGQALKIAERMCLDAEAGKRTIHLVSDFQRSGWASDEQDFRLSPNVELRAVDVGGAQFTNLLPADVQIAETGGEGRDLLVRLSVVNFGTEDRRAVRVNLRVDGQVAASKVADVEQGKVKGLELPVAGLARGSHAIVVEVEDSHLTRDDRFSLTYGVRGKMPVRAVENPRSGRNGRAASFFLAHALNVSDLSPYQLQTAIPGEVDSEPEIAGSLLIWNNTSGGSPALQDKLRRFVGAGNGLAVVVADDSRASDFNRTFASWIPVRVEPPAAEGARRSATRSRDQYSLVTNIRFDHPIFQPFAEPHSGSFSSAKFFSHARLSVGEGAQVPARFDNGDPALVSANEGAGRVLVVPFSADDTSNDLPLKSVYAPFWQQALRYLQPSQQERRWLEVGDSIEPRRVLTAAARQQGKPAAEAAQALVVIDPAGERVSLEVGAQRLTVDRAGFYEIRTSSVNARLAVNTVPNESDLTPGNAEEMVSGWRSTAPENAAPLPASGSLTVEEQEKGQRLWRFVLLAVLLLLVAEGWLSSQTILKPE